MDEEKERIRRGLGEEKERVRRGIGDYSFPKIFLMNPNTPLPLSSSLGFCGALPPFNVVVIDDRSFVTGNFWVTP